MLIVVAINKGDVKDTEIELIMDSIVDSLFSVIVTLGQQCSVILYVHIFGSFEFKATKKICEDFMC